MSITEDKAETIAKRRAEFEATIPYDERSFTPEQISVALNLSLSKTFEVIAQGELQTFKIGRARRATGKAINAYRAAHMVQP